MLRVEAQNWGGPAHASEVNLKSPTCTLNVYNLLPSSNIPSFSSSRYHHHPFDLFLKNRGWATAGSGFFVHNAWPPLEGYGANSAGPEKILPLCLSFTLREFRLFFPRRCPSFRSFNDIRNVMNKRLQIFFRFDHGGNATKGLQCHNLLTPNFLWLFQAWCH